MAFYRRFSDSDKRLSHYPYNCKDLEAKSFIFYKKVSPSFS
ncbi:hypothetical protein X559_2486 [Paenilisteria newyorkensis]|nr:hypothetical protein X559_2486 [Listeria newyorkensis]